MSDRGQTLEVVWPEGRATKGQLAGRERLPDLSGKTIAFVWDYVFRGDDMFEIIKDELRQRGHDDVTFVDHDVFGDTHGADERAVVADIPDKLLQYRVDAAIVGVGA